MSETPIQVMQLGDEEEGIQIVYNPLNSLIILTATYDSGLGSLDPFVLSLQEFLNKLGIKEPKPRLPTVQHKTEILDFAQGTYLELAHCPTCANTIGKFVSPISAHILDPKAAADAWGKGIRDG